MRNGKIVWKLTPLYRILTTNFNFCRWSSTTCKSSHKHGVGARGILASGWLWSYFRYHQAWFFRIWGLIQRDMNLAVEKIPTINNSPSCPCSFCAKVFLSKGELTWHMSTKHYLETVEPNTKVRKMLHADTFYHIIQKSLKKLAQNECYSE